MGVSLLASHDFNVEDSVDAALNIPEKVTFLWCWDKPSLVPRPEKRAWYTLSAHVPKCTENPGTSYISVKQSINYRT